VSGDLVLHPRCLISWYKIGNLFKSSKPMSEMNPNSSQKIKLIEMSETSDNAGKPKVA
jgi:hypothetical protein